MEDIVRTIAAFIHIKTWVSTKDRFNMGPKSQVTWGNPCNLNRWEHGGWDLSLYTGLKPSVPSIDIDAYMSTLFKGGSWVKQKAKFNS